MQDQSSCPKYLYCIVRGSEERTFAAEAIGGRGDGVCTVTHDGLAMVVSDSPAERYDHTRANMIAHETVIEQVMAAGLTVLPVRFGTVTRNSSSSPVEEIRRQVLAARSGDFHDLLEKMENRVELGLKALWRDEKTIYEEILAEHPGLRRTRDALQRKRAEESRMARMRLGERVKEALDRKREREAKALVARLRPLAAQVRENKTVMDRMVLNAAFLVEGPRETAFDEAVQRLDRELGERMVFKYSGPNPPFNFVEIVVTWED